MSKLNTKQSRLRRAKKSRIVIRQAAESRLSIHRTPRHMYAQIFASDGSRVLCAASTLESSLKGSLENTGNSSAAEAVGRAIAQRALAIGIDRVAFDRSGFKYHGRVKALADAARSAGLNF
jgi:large subunit ribosomal protein L18